MILRRAGAKGVFRYHFLAERLVVDALDSKEEVVNEVACNFEYLLHAEEEDSSWLYGP